MRFKYIAIWTLLLLVACQSTPKSSNPLKQSVPKEQKANPSSVQKDRMAKPLSPQEQADLWKRISMQFTLDIPNDPSIDHYRQWYIDHPEHLKIVAERAQPFLYMITTEVEARDLPLELVLLPIVESSFDTTAYSHGGASGLWQFMSPTAKQFGLRDNYWYDGRRDVTASTDAALDYMTALSNRFDGDWEQAIAAYNSGGGRVSRAISQNKKAGKPTDFFSLNLPKETQGYVPKLLALADILSHSDQYGINIPAIANRPVLETVNPNEQLDIAIAAKYAGISIDELQGYNPAFNQWASAPDGPYHFLIPVNKVEQFEKQAAENKGKGIKYVRYKVKAGDSLSRIAVNNQSSTSVIKDTNNLKNNNIRIGQYLLVPRSTQATTQMAKAGPEINGKHKSSYSRNDLNASTRKLVYQVKAGDTLSDIAEKFDVKTLDLVSWNDIDINDYLKKGYELTLHVVTETGNNG